jgi:hypothetical protein
MTEIEFNFIKPTVIFAIIGLFIPGFTALILVGIKEHLTNSGIECSAAWSMIWTTSFIIGLIIPFLFYLHISLMTTLNVQSLKVKLTIFNILEYILIQSSLTPFLTTGHTLCYVIDGQNGIELAFTAWLGLPILILFSFIFNQIFRITNS